MPGGFVIRRRSILALVVVLAAAAIGVERWIVTDREAIHALVEDAAEAVARDDWVALAEAFDEEAAYGARDKAALVNWIRTEQRTHHATHVQAVVGETKLNGDTASARVRATGTGPYGPFVVTADVDFVRRESGWKIAGVRDPELGTPFR